MTFCNLSARILVNNLMLQFNKEIGLKSWIVDFWDESDKGGIDTLQIYSALKELMTELIEILFDHIPTLFS